MLHGHPPDEAAEYAWRDLEILELLHGTGLFR